uniref:Transmembrane protein n=1 Tax=Schistocephalus solidus TaxID=70667 RepID=A0A0X3PXI4_SCHSO
MCVLQLSFIHRPQLPSHSAGLFGPLLVQASMSASAIPRRYFFDAYTLVFIIVLKIFYLELTSFQKVLVGAASGCNSSNVCCSSGSGGLWPKLPWMRLISLLAGLYNLHYFRSSPRCKLARVLIFFVLVLKGLLPESIFLKFVVPIMFFRRLFTWASQTRRVTHDIRVMRQEQNPHYKFS